MFKRTAIILCWVSAKIAADTPETSTSNHVYFLDENPLPPVGLISETSIKAQLSDVSQYHYDQLDKEGRALAFELIHQECKGKNRCRGLNACKNEGINNCASLCSCEGQSPKKFDDPNLAVRVAAKRMAEKRLETINSMK